NRPKPPISAAIVAPTLRIAWLSLKPRQSARATKRSQCRSTAALVGRRRRAKYLFREELHGVDPLRPQRLGQDFRILVCGFRIEAESREAASQQLNEFNDDNSNDASGPIKMRWSHIYLANKN